MKYFFFIFVFLPKTLWTQSTVSPRRVESSTYIKPLKPLTAQLDTLNYPKIIDYIQEEFPFLKKYGYDLTLDTLITNNYGFYLSFWQTFDNTKLKNNKIKLIFDRNGKLTVILSNLFSKPPNTVNKNLRFYYKDSVKGKLFKLENLILAEFNQLRYIISLRTYLDEDGSGFEYQYDSETGELISSVDVSHYFAKDTTAKTLIYNPDPITAAYQFYSCSILLCDNRDSTNIRLDTLRELKTLKNLTYDPDFKQFILSGPYVTIKDITPPKVAPVISFTDTFFFSRNHEGFEDVNTYFHIDTYQRYVQSIGFILHNYPVQADPHGVQGDNSKYVFAGENSYLAFGVGGVDDAEDAVVVVHEYCHALSNAAAPNTFSGFERLAIDEGNSDYLAVSYAKAINDYNWQNVFKWDGHNEFWSGRTTQLKEKYPEVLLKPNINFYHLAEVWSTALMNIQLVLGKTIVDRIVLQSYYMYNNNITFSDAAQLIIDADSLLYNGEHTSIIKRVFCEQLILPNTDCLNTLTPNSNEMPLISVHPNPSNNGLFNITYNGSKQQPTIFRVRNTIGQTVVDGFLSSENTVINLSNYSSGVYILDFPNAPFYLSPLKLINQ